MGKTIKSLWIIAADSLYASPDFQKAMARFEEQGHRVQRLSGATGEEIDLCDLAVGPKFWRMDGALIKYLDVAIKAARATAYPPKSKGE